MMSERMVSARPAPLAPRLVSIRRWRRNRWRARALSIGSPAAHPCCTRGQPPCRQGSSVNVEGEAILPHIVWTIFCIPLNEYGLVTPSLTCRRIIGTAPRRRDRSKSSWYEAFCRGQAVIMSDWKPLNGLSMDLNQLEYFLRVAELGSINRAAKELGLSQPALSRSLSQLEHDLGQQLVVRCRTGITITEAGSILASRGLA